MRDRLLALLETADLAIASCSGVLAAGELDPAKRSVSALRARLGHPEDILVVALAGGTGSGKSSLFNALAGDELADVGGVRPTTSDPQAAVPGAARDSLEGYLDRLGIEKRGVYERETICLIDLPDTDSVETQHRHRVDALLPLVDVVVWVTDPEKYRDARLHREYLRPLALYSSQFICVLNQMDRLTDDQLRQVLADLSDALVEDGLKGVPVLATSASPRVGPPMGIDELDEELELKRSHRRALYEKSLIDLEVMTRQLGSKLGGTEDFDDSMSSVIDAAVESLVSGHTPVAIESLVSFIDALAEETGGVTGDSLRRQAGDVPGHVTRIARTGKPSGRLFRRVASRDTEALRDRLNEAVVRPARALLAKRALARAAVAELAVSIASLRMTSTR